MTNRDLKIQIENSRHRILPTGETYSAAGDLYLFWNPCNGDKDYYHSGVWLNLYGEYIPYERLFLNLKLVALNPSNSYGYNGASSIIPFLSAQYSEKFFNTINVNLLAGDLDRQTLGAGLLVFEKEMSGAILTVEAHQFRTRIVKPGTGVFNHGGDGDIITADWLDNLIGLYLARFSVPVQNSEVYQDENGFFRLNDDSLAEWEYLFYNGIFSEYYHKSGFFYKAEYSRRPSNSQVAHLARIGWNLKGDKFALQAWGEKRRYSKGYFDGISGRMDQDYVSIEDREKEFFNPMNIATSPSSETMWIGGFKGKLFKDSLFRLETRNEVGYWKNRISSKRPVYAFEHAFDYCPWNQKDSCGRFAYSNILIDTWQNPERVQYGNRKLHKLSHHFRVEARVAF